MKITSKCKARYETEMRGWEEAWEEAGMDANGGKAKTEPGVVKTWGFGGLGLEGIIGKEESVGEEEATPLGVGNRGSISGDWVGEADKLEDGAAEMVLVETRLLFGDDEANNNEEVSAIKAKNISQNEEKEAINDHRINCFVMKTLQWMCLSVRESEDVERKSVDGESGGAEEWGGLMIEGWNQTKR